MKHLLFQQVTSWNIRGCPRPVSARAPILRWLPATVTPRASGPLFLFPCFFATGYSDILVLFFHCRVTLTLPSHLQEVLESLVKALCDVQTLGHFGCVKKGAIFCERICNYGMSS